MESGHASRLLDSSLPLWRRLSKLLPHEADTIQYQHQQRHHAKHRLASRGIPRSLNLAWRLLTSFLLPHRSCRDDQRRRIKILPAIPSGTRFDLVRRHECVYGPSVLLTIRSRSIMCTGLCPSGTHHLFSVDASCLSTPKKASLICSTTNVSERSRSRCSTIAS